MNIKSLVVVAVLATAVLCFGGAVGAQTTDNSALIAQLQAQIQSLMQQIQQLIAQQQGGQSWCHTFTNYLVAGSTDTTTNGDITQLQTALTKQGFDVSGDSQGTFGDSTAAAVVQFQGTYGIRQTGTVGPITRAKLNSLYKCPVSSTTSTLTVNIPNTPQGAGATVTITSASGVNQTPITYTAPITLTAGQGYSVMAKSVAGYTGNGNTVAGCSGWAQAGQNYTCSVTYTPTTFCNTDADCVAGQGCSGNQCTTHPNTATLTLNFIGAPQGAGATVIPTSSSGVNGTSITYTAPITLTVGQGYSVMPKSVTGYTVTDNNVAGCSGWAQAAQNYTCNVTYTPVSSGSTPICPSGMEWNTVVAYNCSASPTCPTGMAWNTVVFGNCSGGSQPCPTGQWWDSNHNTCDANPLPCPTGQWFDSNHNTCDANPTCPSGMTFNSSTNLCVGGSTAFNFAQSSIASISDAIAQIAAEIQAMLNK